MTVELTQFAVPAVLGTATGMGLAYWIYKQTIEKWYREEKKTSTKAKLLFWIGVVSCIIISVGAMQIANEIFYVAFNESQIKIDKIIGGLIITIIIPILIFGSAFIVAQLARGNKEKITIENFNEVDYETAYIELKTNTQREGLWAMCLANSNGDENRAKAEYIKKRVLEIRNLSTVRENKNTTEEKESNNITGQKSLLLIAIIVVCGVAYFVWQSVSHIPMTNKSVSDNAISILPQKKLEIPEKIEKILEVGNCEICTDNKCKTADNVLREIKINEKEIYMYTKIDGRLKVSYMPLTDEVCTIVKTDGFSFTCINRPDTNLDGLTQSFVRSYDGKKEYTYLSKFNKLNTEYIYRRFSCEVREK